MVPAAAAAAEAAEVETDEGKGQAYVRRVTVRRAA